MLERAWEKTRRTKLPAIDLWDPEQGERVNAVFDFSFESQGAASLFEGPGLIVAGRQDSVSGYLDAIDLLSQFPRASLAVLDVAGHGLTRARADLFDALLRDWLQRLLLHKQDFNVLMGGNCVAILACIGRCKKASHSSSSPTGVEW